MATPVADNDAEPSGVEDKGKLDLLEFVGREAVAAAQGGLCRVKERLGLPGVTEDTVVRHRHESSLQGARLRWLVVGGRELA